VSSKEGKGNKFQKDDLKTREKEKQEPICKREEEKLPDVQDDRSADHEVEEGRGQRGR
jgi:hypothetical protein